MDSHRHTPEFGLANPTSGMFRPKACIKDSARNSNTQLVFKKPINFEIGSTQKKATILTTAINSE